MERPIKRRGLTILDYRPHSPLAVDAEASWMSNPCDRPSTGSKDDVTEYILWEIVDYSLYEQYVREMVWVSDTQRECILCAIALCMNSAHAQSMHRE